MKCPKCGYIGFESAQKCRNCGYDFSLLAEPVRDFDLPLKRDDPLEAPADFDLRTDDADQPMSLPHRIADKNDFQLPPLVREAESELPLFVPAGAVPTRSDAAHGAGRSRPSSNRPLPAGVPAASAVTPPHRPAPTPAPQEPASTPIRVRAAALPPRPLRGQFLSLKDAELDLEPEPVPTRTPTPRSILGGRPGGSIARAIAGILDVSILLGLDAGVLYFTLRLCRLSFSDTAILPIAPLVAFFLLLDGAYLVAFTAVGGQTIGKMAASLKVVGEDGARVMPGQALVRAAGYVASVLPAGLGFVPGFFGPSRRALHDRLANTRVVQV